MTTSGTKAQSESNQLNALRALHRFGWLRTRDLGTLLFRRWKRGGNIYSLSSLPLLKPEPASREEIRRAQRLVVALTKKKFILSASAPNGSRIHTLSQRGARLLTEQGIAAATGKDLVRDVHAAYFIHRTVSNEVAIAGILEGLKVSTEREISQGKWLGGLTGVHDKKPDALLRMGNLCFWIEVERSRKNQKDYQALLAWLKTLWEDIIRPESPAPLIDKQALAGVVFVCTTAFRDRLKQDLMALGWTENHLKARLFFETSLYSFKATQFY